MKNAPFHSIDPDNKRIRSIHPVLTFTSLICMIAVKAVNSLDESLRMKEQPFMGQWLKRIRG